MVCDGAKRGGPIWPQRFINVSFSRVIPERIDGTVTQFSEAKLRICIPEARRKGPAVSEPKYGKTIEGHIKSHFEDTDSLPYDIAKDRGRKHTQIFEKAYDHSCRDS